VDTLESNERIARRVPEDIATEGRLDLVGEVFAADAVEHGFMGQEMHGPGVVRENLTMLLEAFPDFRARVEDVVAEGDTVAMRVTLSGTHEGGFVGIPPTGKRFEAANMVFTRIEDGKIAERWVVPDSLGMMTQLGVVEPPGGLATDGPA
jgi:steroid delta-isomerase-like uncharacterized protein